MTLHIAPEVDPSTVDPAADLREAIDIDSIEFLNHRTSIEIPEPDNPKLVTMSGMIAYLEAKLKSAVTPHA